jgi:hypothetical protein
MNPISGLDWIELRLKIVATMHEPAQTWRTLRGILLAFDDVWASGIRPPGPT